MIVPKIPAQFAFQSIMFNELFSIIEYHIPFKNIFYKQPRFQEFFWLYFKIPDNIKYFSVTYNSIFRSINLYFELLLIANTAIYRVTVELFWFL